MVRVGVITIMTAVLIYSSLASSYAFAAGPDPHDICTDNTCTCVNNPEDLTAGCCQDGKCKVCDINTTTGDFENCRTVIDPLLNTNYPKNHDGVLEQPPTSSPNDNSGFPKGGVAEDPQISPKVPFNKGGIRAQ